MSIHLTMNRALQVITTFHQKKIQKMDHSHPENHTQKSLRMVAGVG